MAVSLSPVTMRSSRWNVDGGVRTRSKQARGQDAYSAVSPAVQATVNHRYGQKLLCGGIPGSRGGSQGTSEPLQNAPPRATLPSGASNVQTSTNAGTTGEGQTVSGSPGPVPGASTATSIRVPGSDRGYQANYEVRELGDVQTSHNGLNFGPNDRYTLRNDRDYTKPDNQSKVMNWSTASQFDPRYHITDSGRQYAPPRAAERGPFIRKIMPDAPSQVDGKQPGAARGSAPKQPSAIM